MATVKDYYDDPNALNFHNQVWGETFHVARYDLLKREDAKMEGLALVKRAATLTTAFFFDVAFAASDRPPQTMTVMDMGAGQGGAAREIADKSFFDTGVPSSSVDLVISQDSFVHASTEHFRIMQEAARGIRPGGVMVFTDLMQSDDADPAEMAEVHQNILITGMGSPGSYKRWAGKCGMGFIKFDDHTSNVGLHYQHVVGGLHAVRDSLVGVEDHFVDCMLARYGAWCKAAEHNLLRWGIFVFKKKSE